VINGKLYMFKHTIPTSLHENGTKRKENNIPLYAVLTVGTRYLY